MGLAAEGGCVLPVPFGTQTAGGSWDESGSRLSGQEVEERPQLP